MPAGRAAAGGPGPAGRGPRTGRRRGPRLRLGDPDAFRPLGPRRAGRPHHRRRADRPRRRRLLPLRRPRDADPPHPTGPGAGGRAPGEPGRLRRLRQPTPPDARRAGLGPALRRPDARRGRRVHLLLRRSGVLPGLRGGLPADLRGPRRDPRDGRPDRVPGRGRRRPHLRDDRSGRLSGLLHFHGPDLRPALGRRGRRAGKLAGRVDRGVRPDVEAARCGRPRERGDRRAALGDPRDRGRHLLRRGGRVLGRRARRRHRRLPADPRP